MKFPYREYVSQFPGTEDYRLILRPVISIRISGPGATARWDALVDSGADETLLPRSMARVLGVQFHEELTSQAVGITGDPISIHYGQVEFVIESGEERVTWKDLVGFADFGSKDDDVIVLGHGGCLDYFTAIFDGQAAELELIPNSLLP